MELEHFETAADLQEYVVRIIMDTGSSPNLSATHPKVYSFFLSLFQHHPDAIQKGVSLISEIGIRTFGKDRGRFNVIGNYQCIITTTDGKQDDISWTKCIKNYGKKVFTMSMESYMDRKNVARSMQVSF